MPDFIPAARVARVYPSPSTAANQRARELKAAGRDILDLTVGEPDFDTPAPIKAAAIHAIEAGDTKYTPVAGTPALRNAIAARTKARDGIAYGLDQITVGGGAKQVIFMALMASVEHGSEVIVPAPYWVSYPDMVNAADGTPVIVPCGEEHGFKLTPEALSRAIGPATRWLILNAPGNPTGASYSPEELRALADVLLRHPQVWVLVDEIYDEIWFSDTRHPSLVAVEPRLAERTLVVNGVSKTYAMTGWRIGWGAGPAPLVAAINKLQSHSSSCPASVSQAAAVAALTGDQGSVQDFVAVYRDRRDKAVPLINAIPGLTCATPAGAFYLFVGCPGVIGRTTPKGARIGTDLDFVLYLLEEAGVAAVHGGAYGLSPYFRLSIATSMEIIEDACARIARACAALS